MESHIAASPCKGATIDSLLRSAASQLAQSSTPQLDAQLLLAHVLDKPRSWLFAHCDTLLNTQQTEAYLDLIRRRATGTPIAYLRSYVDWLDLHLTVTPDVLVPRPETELLVEEALTLVRYGEPRLVVDLGTGSGAIAIALARALPRSTVLAIDSSLQALDVAGQNIRRYGLAARVVPIHADLLANTVYQPGLIAANLPYLSNRMMEEIDQDVRQEPKSALHAGPTGLEVYAHLFDQLRARGWRIPLVAEIDPRQREAFEQLVHRSLGGVQVRFRDDLAGRTRLAILEPEEEQ